MIQLSCHCGEVRLEVVVPPEEVKECNCSICRRYGARWAYYDPALVRFVSGAASTDTYMWGDKDIAFHRCRTCGCVSHWSPTGPGGARMGVNTRLMPPEAVARARLLQFDGASM
jgi:hypothetical protein